MALHVAHLPGGSLAELNLWAQILEGRAKELMGPQYTQIAASDPAQIKVIQDLFAASKLVRQLIPHVYEPNVSAKIIDILEEFRHKVTRYASFFYSSVDTNMQAAFVELTKLFEIAFLVNVAFFLVLAWLLWVIWRDERITREALVANEALSADNRSKTMMIAGVSHEIRTPLTSLLGVNELLARSALNQEQKEMLATASAAGRNLLSLVNGMLDFGKIEAGGLTLKSASFNLPRLLTQIVSINRTVYDEKQVSLNLFVGSEVPPMVVGDEARLTIIINNLLANAVKFTSSGGSVGLTVGQEKVSIAGESILLFEVADTGIGIAPEAIDKVFGTFTQADSTIVDKYGGAGLGLATCRALVRLHGGEIGVRSEVGQGSTFWVRLPLPLGAESSDQPQKRLRFAAVDPERWLTSGLRQQLRLAGATLDAVEAPISPSLVAERWDALLVDDQVLRHCQDSKSETVDALSRTRPIVIVADSVKLPDVAYRMCFSALSPAADDEDVRRMVRLISSRTVRFGFTPSERGHEIEPSHILLADDNAINRAVITKFLEQGGHAVTDVDTGRAAVDALSSLHFDLAILDINMPEMNGLEAAAAYRAATPEDQRIPLLALTADPSEETLGRCLDVGFVARLVRPISGEDLLDAVRHWMSKERAMP
ncbi:hybrid sensor histidine kinase/response regulator [Acidisoma sp. 7E03]